MNHMLVDILSKSKYFSSAKQLMLRDYFPRSGSRNPAKYDMTWQLVDVSYCCKELYLWYGRGSNYLWLQKQMKIEIIKLWINCEKIITRLRTNISWRLKSLLHFLIAQTFLFCFHCGTISTLSLHHYYLGRILHDSVYFFLDKVEAHYCTFLIHFFFLLIKRNLTDLVEGNNE